ncbi:MAG: 5-formyltetrahydrofolate cyclo-ligase [Jatrophihabitantaceae bacterium]
MQPDYLGHNGRVVSAAKASWRRELTAARLSRPAAAVESARRDVCAVVLGRCAAAGWRCVAAYLPLPSEPGSAALLAALARAGVRVLVPVLRADRDLDWAEWDAMTQEWGSLLGVDSIADADALLVPAVAVARDGTRLGRGGGSYDRALQRVPVGVTVAALLYDGEFVADLPSDDWDVPVTAVVTPAGWQDLVRR